MNNQLFSISKIFSEKLFRIPDYQRGYAWGIKQLKDFWNDIIQLEINQNHYVGVLTLESVSPDKWERWEDDRWIIESKSYDPYYVVDGQQRLTTTIILIQAITEHFESSKKLNYTSIEKIKEKFIFDTKDNGISRSYIFGYEKDNPSYEFLKKKIFLESSGGYRDEETIYTQNLQYAKEFFYKKIEELLPTIEEIEIIYKKVTQHLLFNLYTISSDIDVFVTFETMNNRGKPLSNLELLKNRLIYLSTKFEAEAVEKNQLRKRVNDSWKAVYHFLGKNKDRPLSDDFFLINHFIITFAKDTQNNKGNKHTLLSKYIPYYYEIYSTYLLEEKFTLKNIREKNTSKLTIHVVNNYIKNLQESVKVWYNIFNPTECKDFDDEEKLILDKLYRLTFQEYSSLLLTLYLYNPTKKIRITILNLLEKYVFLSSLTYRYLDHINFVQLSIDLSEKKKFEVVITALEKAIEKFASSKEYFESIIDRFRSNGFYKWKEIKYFLYEYELSLKYKTKTKRDKIDWKQYSQEYDECVTVEHIYPQKPKDEEWTSSFSFHYKQNEKLCNSLGNLLPLSRPKNSSIQNVPFSQKVDNGKDQVGYRYGSYSEIEVSKHTKWTPDMVLERGLLLLDFLETRWGIKLGDKKQKVDILGLNFMLKDM